MRIFRDDRKGSRRKKLLDPLVISILIHLLLAIVLLQKDVLQDDAETAVKKEKDYIEISEIPVQEDEETEPPEKPSVLADRSRKAEEEKTIDETTRLTRQTQQQDLRKPSEKTTPDREEEARKTAEKSEQPEEKKSSEEKEVVKKDPLREKQSLETVKKEPGEIQEKQQQDTTQEETTDEKEIASSPERSTENTPEKEKKDLSEIGRKLVRSTPSRPSVPDAPSSDKKPMYGANVPKKEDTVDLSTKEFKYVSYFTNLKRKIDGVWNYPEESQIRGETGRLFLIFTIRSNGDLEDIELLNSSGYQRLDNEAIRAIKVASPFNPFPDSWDLEKLNIRASFEYRYSRFLR